MPTGKGVTGMENYRDAILEALSDWGSTDLDVRHVEAVLRLEEPTLGKLLPGQLRARICAAAAVARGLGRNACEGLAANLGIAL